MDAKKAIPDEVSLMDLIQKKYPDQKVKTITTFEDVFVPEAMLVTFESGMRIEIAVTLKVYRTLNAPKVKE